jgi:anti-sigma-K factor RsiG
MRAMAWLDAELDRLFAPDYLAGLPDRSMEEIRAMRDECQEAETAVSFLRRVAQGRLDIVHVYLNEDGAEDGAVDLNKLVERLPEIIGAGPPRPPGPGRLPASMGPDLRHADLTDGIDAVLDATRIGELPTMDRAKLQDIADQLGALEAQISDNRRSLHERIDKLQGEIVDRYKRGDASPDGLLA